MAKKMTKEDSDWQEWHQKKMMKMGLALFIIGVILYLAEVKVIPYPGTSVSLGAILLGLLVLAKSFMRMEH